MPIPAPGAQSGQQQTAPPNGSTPATGPTQNKGYEAAGLQRLGSVIKMMTDILPLVGATTDAGKELMKAMTGLSKYVPAGSVSPAADRNNIEQAAMRNTQNNQQMQAVQQMRQGGAQPGQAPQMPGGAAQQAPRAAA
jgi:hypothetical protein